MGLRVADGRFSATGADQWNQIIYKKIAVLGDSLSAQWPLIPPVWPNILQERLNSAGARVEIRDFSTVSHTFFRANTVSTTYGTRTAVQAVIAYKPDIVIVELGVNDAGGMDSRTLVQIQQDATDTYAALAAGIPGVVLIQANVILYDTDNFTTSNVVNKGIIPTLMTKKSSGILSGLDTSEYLDDAVSSANKTTLSNYESLITTITAISGVSVFDLNLFRVCRLGATMTDRNHLTAFGQALVAGYVKKGLAGISAFTALVPGISIQVSGDALEDPDDLFDDYLVASGDGYVDNTPSVSAGENTNSSWMARAVHPDNWYMDYKASFVIGAATYYNSVGAEGMLTFTVSGGAPNVTVARSIDGAAFANTDAVTDQKGNAVGQILIGTLNLSNAAHDFRFKVGTAVFGPESITVAANPIGDVDTTSVSNAGAGEDDLITHTIPAGIAFADAGRGIRVVQHGTFANNANAKTVRSKFGGTTIVSGNLTVNLAGNWRIEYEIYSTADDAQKYQATLFVQTGAGTWAFAMVQGTATENDDAAIVVKCTGQATNDADVTQTFQRVYYE